MVGTRCYGEKKWVVDVCLKSKRLGEVKVIHLYRGIIDLDINIEKKSGEGNHVFVCVFV